MTPIALEILLHYYSHADDFRDGDFKAPVVRELMDKFLREGWIVNPSQFDSQIYGRTPKLVAYIDHILKTPEPQQVWVVPEIQS